ncbi:hypothetical protein [Paraburkholderia acidicola]|uniref:hypothetical protein n=1 Tax=Paraburkholderia acidicola TaxID=1912599 RepID=UPI001055FB06|nr:hypothetical protein [Paraburkholderia acidicola]
MKPTQRMPESFQTIPDTARSVVNARLHKTRVVFRSCLTQRDNPAVDVYRPLFIARLYEIVSTGTKRNCLDKRILLRGVLKKSFKTHVLIIRYLLKAKRVVRTNARRGNGNSRDQQRDSHQHNRGTGQPSKAFFR